MDFYHAFYDLDENRVFVWMTDGRIIAIDCTKVENTFAVNLYDDNDPVWQVLKYVKAIREGKVKKDNGRDFGNMSHVSFYCYVIGDLTDDLIFLLCKGKNFLQREKPSVKEEVCCKKKRLHFFKRETDLTLSS